MNRQEFMSRLAAELKKLPQSEVDDILAYYNEYLDDAGFENEEQALKELGSPVKIATQVKADYAVKQLEKVPKQGMDSQQTTGKKKGLSVVWWVILGIFAAPVALPVAIAAGAVAIAMFCVVGALILAALVTVGAVFAGGIVCIVAGGAILFADFANAAIILGVGFAIVGAMLFLGWGIIVGARALIGFIARKTNESRQRKTAKRQDEQANGEGDGTDA